jgi:hypothetical protein
MIHQASKQASKQEQAQVASKQEGTKKCWGGISRLSLFFVWFLKKMSDSMQEFQVQKHLFLNSARE